MLFAFDYNDNRIHIDDTRSNEEYFCPYCGATLITKKGTIRQHHFSHKSNHQCSDSWEQSKSYDTSLWHNEWQNHFPKENQEVKLSLGGTTHRADVLVGRNVIEFQHSVMSSNAFNDRNNFYLNLGYNVIWLFDLSDIVEHGNITYYPIDDELSFRWRNPKKAFNGYDVKTGCIDLFFQLYNREQNCIVRVSDVSEFGFEDFTASNLMSKNEFLAYAGLANGVCPPPDRTDLESNESYLRFKKKYNINLNKQQERTIQSIEGSVLLLAVPGSGKTTVLVDRLGYMVCEKGIDPSSILAITFNKSAAEEMKRRFSHIFGDKFGTQISFRTINSLCSEIYSQFCKSRNKKIRKIIQDNYQRKILNKLYQKYFSGKRPSESSILEFRTLITYAKNMMLTDDQITDLNSESPKFSAIFHSYCDSLQEEGNMDFDDQMVFAHWILTYTAFWQKNYHYQYICVDEAQDTSKIQHAIIQAIAKDNNIFMVGDEDQSIYGFRAAYPKALLNFRKDYHNPYVLRMERNYRSTPQIVEKAQSFISENKGRYEKKMIADRDNGKPVELIPVDSLEVQYLKILSIAQSAKKEIAVLYRDNESSVVLVDLFLRNGIPFRLKKPEMNFFRNSIVRDIVAYLSIIINPFDTNSLKQVCNKGIIYLQGKQLSYAIMNCKVKNITVLDSVESQIQYLPYHQRNQQRNQVKRFKELSGKNTEQAIHSILEYGYENYLKEKQKDFTKIEILLILAKQEPDIQKYLNRLIELETLTKNGFHGTGHVTLSTIHSSKGSEYDTVYLIDVYDGRFPASSRNLFSRSKDNADGEQEERRLFYVGITRAKNELYLFHIKEKTSSYIDSLFPEVTHKKLKDLFIQQETQIRDSHGVRWIKCEVCGKILPSRKFVSYGGPNHVNLGICYNCSKNLYDIDK